jgi:hypothetical protein
MAKQRRYAILDVNGRCVNVVLVDDPMPADYWPGYGYYIVDQGSIPPITPDTEPIIASSVLIVPSAKPNRKIQIGDVMVINSGTVFSYVPDLIVQDGETVSSAPDVDISKPSDIKP